MKTTLISFLLLVLWASACRNDNSVGPADLLHQRWHLDRTKKVGDEAWMMSNTDGYYDTEYRPDGALIYRKDGVIKLTSCCEAGRYERSGNVIQYRNFVACPTVFCAPAKSSDVTVLKENLLELQNGNWITQYTPAK